MSNPKDKKSYLDVDVEDEIFEDEVEDEKFDN